MGFKCSFPLTLGLLPSWLLLERDQFNNPLFSRTCFALPKKMHRRVCFGHQRFEIASRNATCVACPDPVLPTIVDQPFALGILYLLPRLWQGLHIVDSCIQSTKISPTWRHIAAETFLPGWGRHRAGERMPSSYRVSSLFRYFNALLQKNKQKAIESMDSSVS